VTEPTVLTEPTLPTHPTEPTVPSEPTEPTELVGAAARRRDGRRHRATRETDVKVHVALDGTGDAAVDTGVPFFDHMLAQLARHGGLDLELTVRGDLDVDTHHSVEDAGIALGEALAEALGDRAGVRRFASVSVPLDEALVDVALDLSGRPFLRYDVELPPGAGPLGNPGFDPQLAEEFWRALAGSAGITLHVTLRYGRNTHHILEASFKGVARALRDAARVEGGGVPSTKGVLGSRGGPDSAADLLPPG
jgi:imidazoleglycerol-phosphate dehydratase